MKKQPGSLVRVRLNYSQNATLTQSCVYFFSYTCKSPQISFYIP